MSDPLEGLIPCPDVSLPDLSGITTPEACSQAAANNPAFNISWKCETTVVEQCKEITETEYVDATPVFVAAYGPWGSTPNTKPTINGPRLTSEVQKYLQNGNIRLRPPLDNIAGDQYYIQRIMASLDWEKMSQSWQPGADGRGNIKIIYKDFANIDPRYRFDEKAFPELKRQMDQLMQEYIKKAQDALDIKNIDKLPPKAKAALVKQIADFMAKYPNSWKCAKYTLPGIGIALTLSDFLEASELGDSEINWRCPDPAGNNNGTVNPDGPIPLGNGTYRLPDGSTYKDPDYQGTDSRTPSRSQFIRSSVSKNMNISELNNTQMPSIIKNNRNIYINNGMPNTSFPVAKVPKPSINIDDRTPAETSTSSPVYRKF